MCLLLTCFLMFVGLVCSNAHLSLQLNNPIFSRNVTTGPPIDPAGKIWALLVAGSEGWTNYRHQADVCHGYQILRTNGIPEENIIVMMSDDIAFHQDNPTPGVIINYPGGPDVYKGVPKDYTGKDVTVKNFLNILTGNKTAMMGIGSGKVIESGPDDVVFVNFVDHGGLGVLYFPNEELFADEFLETINLMSIKSKYSKLIIYIEACHAGSMFDNMLSDTTNVFALTGADPHESSYACYYDEERETYLGDVFSVIWMNDTEHESLARESLHHQFEKVRTYTNTSHVEEYGDLDIGVTKLKDVLGFRMRLIKEEQNFNLSSSSSVIKPHHPMDTADNMDVPLNVLEKKKRSIRDPKKLKALELEIDDLYNKRDLVNKLFNATIVRVADNISPRKKELKTSKYGLTLDNYPCYKKLYKTFSSCLNFIWNPYARVHLQKFVNICSAKWLKEDKVIEDIKSACIDVLGSMIPKNIM